MNLRMARDETLQAVLFPVSLSSIGDETQQSHLRPSLSLILLGRNLIPANLPCDQVCCLEGPYRLIIVKRDTVQEFLPLWFEKAFYLQELRSNLIFQVALMIKDEFDWFLSTYLDKCSEYQ